MFFIPSGSHTISASPSLRFPELQGGGIWWKSHLKLNVPRFLTLCTMSGCGSTYLFPSAAARWWLNKELISEYIRIIFRSHNCHHWFISFIRPALFGFTSYVIVFGPFSIDFCTVCQIKVLFFCMWLSDFPPFLFFFAIYWRGCHLFGTFVKTQVDGATCFTKLSIIFLWATCLCLCRCHAAFVTMVTWVLRCNSTPPYPLGFTAIPICFLSYCDCDSFSFFFLGTFVFGV